MNGKLIVSEGGRDRIHEICEEVTIVGKGPHADLHLKDGETSPRHVEIRWTGTGFELLDLETLSGTKVNGAFVNQHSLVNGDTIQIGQARLTYLGDSAAAPSRKPRHQPEPVLKAHPRGDDGEPKRYYRHEAKVRSGNPGVTIAIIFIGLGLAACAIWWAASRDYAPPGKRQFSEAGELIKSDEIKDIKKAIRILENLPEGAVGTRELKDRLDDGRSRLAELEAAQRSLDCKRRYQEIRSGYLEDKKGVGWLKGQVKVFVEDFSGTYEAEQLASMLEKIELGGEDKEREWQKTLEALRKARGGKNYKAAFEILDKAEMDKAFRKLFGSNLSAKRSALEHEFKRHFQLMSEAAELARKQGDPAEARRIYSDLAAVGLEPYATQARELASR